MYRILRKKVLNPTVTLMDIDAPLVAKKAEPGQFIILRVDENGERIPLTVADYDREKGIVTIIFQVVGATTEKLNHLEEGDSLHDFVGPLGVPSHVEGLKKVAVIGGGVGCAIAYPIAKKLHHLGAEVHSIVDVYKRQLLHEELQTLFHPLQPESCSAYHLLHGGLLHGVPALLSSVFPWHPEFHAAAECFSVLHD